MRKSYLNRIKANISIYARKNTSSLLDGNYKSIYKGKSLNFDGVFKKHNAVLHKKHPQCGGTTKKHPH